mmetsp:Transcript_18652/g.34559  ORF Transcript_18652/g.34559 Transcript_18652/m.34559 type:complete len:1042 (-) Transcript_18652:48-3173(-)
MRRRTSQLQALAARGDGGGQAWKSAQKGSKVTAGSRESLCNAAQASGVPRGAVACTAGGPQIAFLLDVQSLQRCGVAVVVALVARMVRMLPGNGDGDVRWGVRLWDASPVDGCTPREMDVLLRKQSRATHFFRAFSSKHLSRLEASLRSVQQKLSNYGTARQEVLGTAVLEPQELFQSSVDQVMTDMNWDSGVHNQNAISSYVVVLSPCPQTQDQLEQRIQKTVSTGVQALTPSRSSRKRKANGCNNPLELPLARTFRFFEKHRRQRLVSLIWVDSTTDPAQSCAADKVLSVLNKGLETQGGCALRLVQVLTGSSDRILKPSDKWTTSTHASTTMSAITSSPIAIAQTPTRRATRTEPSASWDATMLVPVEPVGADVTTIKVSVRIKEWVAGAQGQRIKQAQQQALFSARKRARAHLRQEELLLEQQEAAELHSSVPPSPSQLSGHLFSDRSQADQPLVLEEKSAPRVILIGSVSCNDIPLSRIASGKSDTLSTLTPSSKDMLPAFAALVVQLRKLQAAGVVAIIGEDEAPQTLVAYPVSRTRMVMAQIDTSAVPAGNIVPFSDLGSNGLWDTSIPVVPAAASNVWIAAQEFGSADKGSLRSQIEHVSLIRQPSELSAEEAELDAELEEVWHAVESGRNTRCEDSRTENLASELGPAQDDLLKESTIDTRKCSSTVLEHAKVEDEEAVDVSPVNTPGDSDVEMKIRPASSVSEIASLYSSTESSQVFANSLPDKLGQISAKAIRATLLARGATEPLALEKQCILHIFSAGSKDPLSKTHMKALMKAMTRLTFSVSRAALSTYFKDVLGNRYVRTHPKTLGALASHFDLALEPGGTSQVQEEKPEALVESLSLNSENMTAASHRPSSECSSISSGEKDAETAGAPSPGLSRLADSFRVTGIVKVAKTRTDPLALSSQRYSLNHFTSSMTNLGALMRQRKAQVGSNSKDLLADQNEDDIGFSSSTSQSSHGARSTEPAQTAIPSTPVRVPETPLKSVAETPLGGAEDHMQFGSVKCLFDSPERVTPDRSAAIHAIHATPPRMY